VDYIYFYQGILKRHYQSTYSYKGTCLLSLQISDDRLCHHKFCKRWKELKCMLNMC